MFTNYWVAVLIAVLLTTITSARSIPFNNTTEARMALTAHQFRTTQFKCSSPQPRAYKIRKIIPFGQIATHEVIFPVHTVIRTCDEGTGCCTSEEMTCAPAVIGGLEYEEVVVKVSSVVGVKTGTLRTMKIVHHKKCECRFRSEYTPSLPTITLVDQ